VIARLVAVATLLLTTAGSPAHGEDAPSPNATGTAPAGAPSPAPDDHAHRRPELVEITVVGRPPDYENLRLRVGARIAGGVPLVWNRIDRFNPLAELLRGVPAARAATLRCWVDLTDARRATLYFAGEGGDRFFVRELALSGRLDEIDQQSLAQVLELSISALMENRAIGFTRDEARELFSRTQPPAPAATAPAVPARRWSVMPAVSYAVESVGASLPIAQGPGVAVAFSPADGVGLRLGLWVAAQYQLPATAHRPEIAVRLQTAAARAGVEARWWRLRARLGAGTDSTYVTPLAGTAGAANTLTVAGSHWSTSWVATGALSLRLPLEKALRAASRLALSAVIFVDLHPAGTQYQLQDSSGARVLFAAERGRPGLGLELAF
jgi:hypothetical protein